MKDGNERTGSGTDQSGSRAPMLSILFFVFFSEPVIFLVDYFSWFLICLLFFDVENEKKT